MPEPNLEAHVFCRVNRDVGNIELETGRDRETTDLQKDELLVIQYRLIASLIDDNFVQLI